ncbi:hypothetical protein BDQ12DRAFT_609610, partial [Crucibulum laeve]
QLWAASIDESEIEITTWITCEERQGRWNNQDVDLYIAWNNETSSYKWANGQMRGYRFLQGLDLCYEILGHVIFKGRIIGIMTEPSNGRLVEKQDRTLVYTAISRLEERRLYDSPRPENIMISRDGKIRLLAV